MSQAWKVRFEWDFAEEFEGFTEDVQAELLAHADILEEKGPELSRPHVDHLKGSAYSNMKELRFTTEDGKKGVWRVAFAFDRQSRAVLLIAGDKSGLWGKAEKDFYKNLIKKADTRFGSYLKRVEEHSKRKCEEGDRKSNPAETKRTKQKSK